MPCPRYGIGLYAPAGFAQDPAALDRAVARLEALGHRVVVDPTCRARWQRFAAPDDERLAAVLRMAADPRVELAITLRGGYGWTRLLAASRFQGAGERRQALAGLQRFHRIPAGGARARRHGDLRRAVGHRDFGARVAVGVHARPLLRRCSARRRTRSTCALDGARDFAAVGHALGRQPRAWSRTWSGTPYFPRHRRRHPVPRRRRRASVPDRTDALPAAPRGRAGAAARDPARRASPNTSSTATTAATTSTPPSRNCARCVRVSRCSPACRSATSPTS